MATITVGSPITPATASNSSRNDVCYQAEVSPFGGGKLFSDGDRGSDYLWA
jgi:hypothetical protein